MPQGAPGDETVASSGNGGAGAAGEPANRASTAVARAPEPVPAGAAPPSEAPAPALAPPPPDGAAGWQRWIRRASQPAPASAPPPVGGAGAGASGKTRIGYLRDFRSMVQDVGALLQDVRAGTSTLAEYEVVVNETLQQAELLLEAAEAKPGTSADDDDALLRIRNAWRLLKLSPLLVDPAATHTPEAQLRYLTELDKRCRTIVFEVGKLTIPARLNVWLKQARPGYYVPFHAVFKDEVPNDEDRAEVLRFLAWSPKAVQGGLVSEGSGLIYRYDQDRTRQWLSLGGVAAALAAATALVVAWCYPRSGITILGATLQVESWPFGPENLATFAVGWAAVLAGVVVHAAVGAAKRMQDPASLPPVIAVTELLPRVNAEFGPILLKVLLALVGFFGLVFAVPLAQVTALTAFLVGYSLDSVVGLFGASLEQRAAAQVASLKSALGGA